jgi:hypothetical protein
LLAGLRGCAGGERNAEKVVSRIFALPVGPVLTVVLVFTMVVGFRPQGKNVDLRGAFLGVVSGEEELPSQANVEFAAAVRIEGDSARNDSLRKVRIVPLGDQYRVWREEVERMPPIANCDLPSSVVNRK